MWRTILCFFSRRLLFFLVGHLFLSFYLPVCRQIIMLSFFFFLLITIFYVFFLFFFQTILLLHHPHHDIITRPRRRRPPRCPKTQTPFLNSFLYAKLSHCFSVISLSNIKCFLLFLLCFFFFFRFPPLLPGIKFCITYKLCIFFLLLLSFP